MLTPDKRLGGALSRIDWTLTAIRFYLGCIIALLALILWRVW